MCECACAAIQLRLNLVKQTAPRSASGPQINNLTSFTWNCTSVNHYQLVFRGKRQQIRIQAVLVTVPATSLRLCPCSGFSETRAVCSRDVLRAPKNILTRVCLTAVAIHWHLPSNTLVGWFSMRAQASSAVGALGFAGTWLSGWSCQLQARGSVLPVLPHPLAQPQDWRRQADRHTDTQTQLDVSWEWAAPAPARPELLLQDRCRCCPGVQGWRGGTETNLPCETLMVNKRRQRNMEEREREKCNCRQYIQNTWRTRKEWINQGCGVNRECLLYNWTFRPGQNLFKALFIGDLWVWTDCFCFGFLLREHRGILLCFWGSCP